MRSTCTAFLTSFSFVRMMMRDWLGARSPLGGGQRGIHVPRPSGAVQEVQLAGVGPSQAQGVGNVGETIQGGVIRVCNGMSQHWRRLPAPIITCENDVGNAGRRLRRLRRALARHLVTVAQEADEIGLQRGRNTA